MSEGAVCGDDDNRVPGLCEGRSGVVGNGGVDFHGYDMAGAGAFGEKGGVVAGAGADLQDVHACLHVQQVKHFVHEPLSAAGAGREDTLAVIAVVAVVNLDSDRIPAVYDRRPCFGVVGAP